MQAAHGARGRVVETVVIGGGQAGLATGYHLRRLGRSFVILDATHRIGDSWRRRWDTLRLFTPAGFSHLPGMGFPDRRGAAPTKDGMADYLAAYAARFGLPVEHGTRVAAVRRDGTALLVTATDQQEWRARNVVVATGAHTRPLLPHTAGELSPQIRQIHSCEYRRPTQLPTGPVLVVGAGNSGAEIALDLASPAQGPARTVYLAGRDVGHIPRLGTWTYPLMQLLGPVGAALSARGLKGGAEPLGRIRPGELEAAGVRRLPRIVGARKGLPLAADGRAIEVNSTVWCTGSRPDHRFLLPLAGDDSALRSDGGIAHRKGVCEEPGIYVVGMPSQSSITSHLVGGVGKDAKHVARHIARRG